ncbi:MAG: HNH endonuclease [Betaproteobacteria bacterium RIFCSPLOWO2_02_FULL_62_17]|nr:MAG: HNH endonuclease [Betaproteobacteria bacterium RIFCSPLOWO2_02_FULL_62_17]
MPSNNQPPGKSKVDKLVAEARRQRDLRESGYRERALKLFPWICGRCAREFTGANVRMLTVHHKDGNHDNNAPDGSNWELLCLYCHENEHARLLDQAAQEGGGAGPQAPATHKPFAALESLLKRKDGE